MRYFSLLGVLCCVCLWTTPVQAQVPSAHEGQSIEGSWIAEVAGADGTITLFEVGSFSPEGSYTGANVNGLHGVHKGVWERIGHLQFTLTVLFFTHDAQGAFNGIVKARIYITLAPDLNSYDSVAERIVMDKFGNVLSTTTGIAGHAVRMEVELPQYLAPPV